MLLRRAYMAGVGQAELGAFDNQERALANILWRATWGHGMRPCFRRLPMSLYSTVVRSVVHGLIRDRSQRWLRGSAGSKGKDRCRV